MTYFCVIQKGHAVFGIGYTEEEAMENAKHWLGNDDQDLLWDCLPSYSAANDGELALVPCTEELFGFIQDGGDPSEFQVIFDEKGGYIADHDPCGGRSCDECEIGGCDHGREVV